MSFGIHRKISKSLLNNRSHLLVVFFFHLFEEKKSIFSYLITLIWQKFNFPENFIFNAKNNFLVSQISNKQTNENPMRAPATMTVVDLSRRCLLQITHHETNCVEIVLPFHRKAYTTLLGTCQSLARNKVYVLFFFLFVFDCSVSANACECVYLLSLYGYFGW